MRFRFLTLGLGLPALLALAACASQTEGNETLANTGAFGGGGSDAGGMAPAAGGMAPSAGTGPSNPGAAGTGTMAGTSPGGSAAGGMAGSGGTAGAGGGGGAGGADECPMDPNKTAPGKCGCGAADEDSVLGAGCGPLQDSIIHRYGFEGNPNDSVGTAHGVLKGGATIVSGALTLAGAQSGQYLDLPNGLISQLSSLTVEAWVTWTGAAGGDWQRVFDFGSSNMAEDVPGTGNKYLFLSTRKFRGCYTSATPPSEIFTDSATDFPTATKAHVALAVDSTAHKLSIFLDGQEMSSVTLNLPLSAINDVNNWIGRSQFAPDDYFGGSISEFRIYSAALTGPVLKTSIKMGENTTFLKKP